MLIDEMLVFVAGCGIDNCKSCIARLNSFCAICDPGYATDREFHSPTCVGEYVFT